MRLRREVELTGFSPTAYFLIVVLGAANWNTLVRQVRNALEDFVESFLVLLDALFERWDLIFQSADFRGDGIKLRRFFGGEDAFLFFPFQLTDALRVRVLLRLGRFEF